MSELFNHSKKLNDALQTLNDAARQKRGEIKKILNDRYSEFQDTLEDLTSGARKNIRKARKAAADTWEEGVEAVESTVKNVDKKARLNPWGYIGKAAAGAFLVGLVLGILKKKN